MQLIDLAFRERDQFDVSMVQSFENRRHIFLIPADPIEGLGDNHVEISCSRGVHQGQHTRPRAQRACADRVVAEDLNDLMPRSQSPFSAEPNLVID
jgi:hypothetical protein